MSQADNLSDASNESFHESDGYISGTESDYNPKGEHGPTKKMKYRVITEDKRKMLIELIENEKLSIAKAAKKAGIKYSTAKTIYGVFQLEGRITTKLRRGVGAEKKRKTQKKAAPKKVKVPKKKVEENRNETEVKVSGVKTRGSQRKNSDTLVEQTSSQPLKIKTESLEIVEPALTKIVKKEEYVHPVQTQLPIQSSGNLVHALPLQMSQPKQQDTTKEQQLLLSRLNSLITNNSYIGGIRNLPPIPQNHLNEQELLLLRMRQNSLMQNVYPTTINCPILRNAAINPYLNNNLPNPLLFQNSLRNPFNYFKP